MSLQGADVIRIAGRVMTLGRARMLGLVDAAGNVIEQEPVVKAGKRSKAEPKEPVLQPLIPQNVTKSGEPIEDPALLEAIVEKTEAKHKVNRAQAAQQAAVQEAVAPQREALFAENDSLAE